MTNNITGTAENITQAPEATNHKWYVLNAYSGSEKAVAAQIREKAARFGHTDKFSDILVPTEDVVEVKRGQKVQTERKFLPGYLLVKMDMNDETWHLVKSIARVTGFLGAKRPTPISEKEAQNIMKQVQEGVEKPRSGVAYEVGEVVRVVDGPFNSFTGGVESVDEEKGRLVVAVSIFGRATPVELDYTQVEKYSE